MENNYIAEKEFNRLGLNKEEYFKIKRIYIGDKSNIKELIYYIIKQKCPCCNSIIQKKLSWEAERKDCVLCNPLKLINNTRYKL